MDVHEREARRLIAGGADPRRAGPVAAAHFGLPRTLTAAQTMAVGGLAGLLATVAVASVLALAFGLHVTSATVPQAESPAKTAIEAALSSIPQTDQEAVLADLLGLVPLSHDPTARQLAHVLRALSREQRQSLAEEPQLGRLLGEFVVLSAQQRTTLVAVAGYPDSVDLLATLGTRDGASATALEPGAVRLVTQLADLTDPALRSATTYVLDQIRFGNPEVLRLLTAYWYREPALIAALAASSPSHEPRSRHAR